MEGHNPNLDILLLLQQHSSMQTKRRSLSAPLFRCGNVTLVHLNPTQRGMIPAPHARRDRSSDHRGNMQESRETNEWLQSPSRTQSAWLPCQGPWFFFFFTVGRLWATRTPLSRLTEPIRLLVRMPSFYFSLVDPQGLAGLAASPVGAATLGGHGRLGADRHDGHRCLPRPVGRERQRFSKGPMRIRPPSRWSQRYALSGGAWSRSYRLLYWFQPWKKFKQETP